MTTKQYAKKMNMTEENLLRLSEELYAVIRENAAWKNGRRLPISLWNIIENELRPAMRARNLRAIYRGPRVHNKLGPWSQKASMTMRCDAKFVDIVSYGK